MLQFACVCEKRDRLRLRACEKTRKTNDRPARSLSPIPCFLRVSLFVSHCPKIYIFWDTGFFFNLLFFVASFHPLYLMFGFLFL